LRSLAILGGIIAGLAVVLTGGSYMLLRPGDIAQDMARQISASTGFALKTEAPAQFSLWPEPKVILNKVSLLGPQAPGSVPLSVESLVIATDLSALFSGHFAPKSIEAHGARLNLLIDAKGATNWDPRFGGLPLPIKVSDGTLVFLDERSGAAFKATGLDATLAPQDTGEGLKSFGEFVWRRQPVHYTVQLKSLARLMEDGSPVSVTANGPTFDFFFDGRAGLAKKLALAGQFSVNSDDFRGMAHWLGSDIPGNKGFAEFMLAGAIDTAGSSVQVTRATLRLDETSASGRLGFDFANKTPKITGDLVADEIDFDTYFGDPQKAGPEWSGVPFALAGLDVFDTALDISFGHVSYGDAELRDARTRIEQRDGVLEARVAETMIDDGKASARLRLAQPDGLPEIAFSFAGDGINSQQFLADLFGITALKGPAHIQAELSTSGKTQAEMVANLAGNASLAIDNGQLMRLDPDALLRQVSARVVEGWQGETPVSFHQLRASFSIADGIASITDMSYADAALSMQVSGDTDILRRAVNLKAQPRYVGAVSDTAAWPVPVVVAGPWASPKFFPDIAELPADPAAGFQKLRTMGLPVLLSPAQN